MTLPVKKKPVAPSSGATGSGNYACVAFSNVLISSELRRTSDGDAVEAFGLVLAGAAGLAIEPECHVSAGGCDRAAEVRPFGSGHGCRRAQVDRRRPTGRCRRTHFDGACGVKGRVAAEPTSDRVGGSDDTVLDVLAHPAATSRTGIGN